MVHGFGAPGVGVMLLPGDVVDEGSLEGDARHGEAVAGGRDLHAHGAFSVAWLKPWLKNSSVTLLLGIALP